MPTDPSAKGTYRLPDGIEDDLKKIQLMVGQVADGTLSAEGFRAFRVPMGIYEQREREKFMLRVRLPGGVLLPPQMRILASVSEQYGNGVLHVTTRQDIQVHRMPMESIHPALAALLEEGLTTKGGGGNTVRNITACPFAGVCSREAFDVTPYVISMTEFLLANPLSYQLPRKYKLAFSGCGCDCAGATVNDLGLIAKNRDGVCGFTVYVGGGMGARSRVAGLLEEFVPAEEIYLIAEAVKRVFDQHGDRKNRHKARLRFLIEKIGLEAFRKLYEEELAELRESPPALPHVRANTRATYTPAVRRLSRSSDPDFCRWSQFSVLDQRHPGYKIVVLPLPLGDMDAESLRSLADVVNAHGEGVLRTTQSQNVIIRWVKEAELEEIYARLSSLGLARSVPPVLREIAACTGASTCRLGICQSRGLAKAIVDELCQSDLDLDKLEELKIHINGCPNACGRGPIAQIGFFGAARHRGERLVPHYAVCLGGRVGEGKTQLAEKAAVIPARNVPAFLRDFLEEFVQSPFCPDFEAFLDSGGRKRAGEIATEYKKVPSFDEEQSFYFDWNAEEPFSLADTRAGK